MHASSWELSDVQTCQPRIPSQTDHEDVSLSPRVDRAHISFRYLPRRLTRRSGCASRTSRPRPSISLRASKRLMQNCPSTSVWPRTLASHAQRRGWTAKPSTVLSCGATVVCTCGCRLGRDTKRRSGCVDLTPRITRPGLNSYSAGSCARVSPRRRGWRRHNRFARAATRLRPRAYVG